MSMTHHMKRIRSECQRMGQKTAYQLEKKENRINDKHDLDARGLGDSHYEPDDVGRSLPSYTKLNGKF